MLIQVYESLDCPEYQEIILKVDNSSEWLFVGILNKRETERERDNVTVIVRNSFALSNFCLLQLSKKVGVLFSGENLQKFCSVRKISLAESSCHQTNHPREVKMRRRQNL